MTILYLDLETFCETKITHGTYRYAEDAEVMLVAIAKDNDPVEVWDTQDNVNWRSTLLLAVAQADKVVIHNSNFDRTVLRHCGVNIPVENIIDTMVLALSHGLPASLGQLCDVLNVPQDKAKDKAGKKLIHLFTKPCPKNWKLRRATRETHPDEWNAFIEYARLDVDAMRDVHGRLPHWNDTDHERNLWITDQRINDRGIAVDLDFARSALRAFDRASRTLATRAAHLTGGSVTSTTQRQRLLDHFKDKLNFEPEDLTRATLGNLLSGDLDPEVRELLEIRQQAAATSPAKYTVLLNGTSRDGRLRGLIQFCGAARTGRDAGRLFQPQNLPRSPDWFDDVVQETTVAAFKADCEDIIWDNVSERCAFGVRGALVAPVGRKLVIADLSNIEGRVLAWLAGENWKIEAFKAYDRGDGHDLYKVTAGRILDKDPADITKSERQSMGKVPELACLGLDTRVLTNNGVKAITKVSIDDLLWDGEEWVRHEGLIDRGNRSTIWLAGLELTPDHEVLVGQTWQQAQTVVSCQSTRDHALATGMANLPWSAWNSGLWAAYERLSWPAHVALPPTAWLSATCEKGGAHAATAAPKSLRDDGLSDILVTPPSAPMKPTEGGYVTASQLASTDAIIPTIGLTTITADAASTSTNCGELTERHISRILSRLTGGTDLNSNLIELMSTGVTSRVISVSSDDELTVTTCDAFGICNSASKNLRPVYDIANAGPRNRFTVLTEDGAFIVHNCGYQGGVGAFRKMGGQIVGAMSDEAIQEIVTGWRKAHPRTRSLWYDMEAAAREAINNLGESFGLRDLITFDVKPDTQGIAWLRMRLPSGRYLCYPRPEVSDSGSITHEGMNQYTRKWERLDTYGGKLTENAVQAIARDVFMSGMLRAEVDGFEVCIRVHDELVCETPDDPTYTHEGLAELMSTNPSWSAGLPLSAAGFETKRYRKE